MGIHWLNYYRRNSSHNSSANACLCLIDISLFVAPTHRHYYSVNHWYIVEQRTNIGKVSHPIQKCCVEGDIRKNIVVEIAAIAEKPVIVVRARVCLVVVVIVVVVMIVVVVVELVVVLVVVIVE